MIWKIPFLKSSLNKTAHFPILIIKKKYYFFSMILIQLSRLTAAFVFDAMEKEWNIIIFVIVIIYKYVYLYLILL